MLQIKRQVCGSGNFYVSLRSGIRRACVNNHLLLALVLAMEGVILITFGTLFYQFLRQDGRILLRLDFMDALARL